MNNYNGYNYGTTLNPRSPFGEFSRPLTNVTFVTSLEEALFKTTGRDCEMVYFDQDKPVFYRVKIDNEGRKSWMQFEYSGSMHDDNSPVTRKDLLAISAKIEAIEKQLKGEITNYEPNGQSSNAFGSANASSSANVTSE